MSELRVKQHPVYGFLVCTDGRVCLKGNWTYGTRNRCGYMQIGISIEGVKKNLLVHRVIAETFIPAEDTGLQVDHINRDKTDNRLANLRFVTRSENQRNTKANDRCIDHVGIHSYEDPREYNRRNCRQWYYLNREEVNARRRASNKLLRKVGIV